MELQVNEIAKKYRVTFGYIFRDVIFPIISIFALLHALKLGIAVHMAFSAALVILSLISMIFFMVRYNAYLGACYTLNNEQETL